MASAPGTLYVVLVISMAQHTRPEPASRGLLGTLVRAPWSARAWAATVHVLVGLPIGLVTFIVVVYLAVATLAFAITAVIAIGTLAALLYCVRAFTALQRSRFAALLGVEIAPPPRHYPQTTWLRRLLAEARAGTTWRQLGYHLLALAIGVGGAVLVGTAWSAGLTLSTALAHGWALPSDGIFGWDMRSPAMLLALTGIGLVVLFAAPWLAQAVAALDAAAARALLGPAVGDELAHRVATLTESRAGVVDAAAAERRRIERDLHDGTQQRLVSLAMRLGMTRAELADAPEPTRRAIEQAHNEAKQALAELRAFVRGLHPAVLDDRGLDAALSGITARAPVPVRLRVDVPRRPAPTIEAIAYFIVSEALTNVAKHAHASHAEVTVERDGDRLRISVSDDGRGGARLDGGSGLRGLAQRVAAVDGTLRVDSPPGGPTRIQVELPCES